MLKSISFQVPVLKPTDLMVEVRPRRIFANGHTYHVNSISVNSDGETYLSADDLRINMWHLDITDRSFSILHVYPPIYIHRKNIKCSLCYTLHWLYIPNNWDRGIKVASVGWIWCKNYFWTGLLLFLCVLVTGLNPGVLCSRLRSCSSFEQGSDLEIKYLWKHLNNSPRKRSLLKHIIAAFRKIVGCVLACDA